MYYQLDMYFPNGPNGLRGILFHFFFLLEGYKKIVSRSAMKISTHDNNVHDLTKLWTLGLAGDSL